MRARKWWSPERDAVLKAKWGKERAQAIAEAIDPDLTREEVIRQASRLGLPPIPKATSNVWASETRRAR